MKARWVAAFLCCLFLGAAEEPRYLEIVRSAVVCEKPGPVPPDFSIAECAARPISKIDSQGREIWLQARINIPEKVVASGAPLALHIGALASSEIYWNGRLIGANGTPGGSKDKEKPGKLDAALFIPQNLLVVGENDVAIRMASFHNPVRLHTPFHYLYAAAATPNVSLRAHHYAPALLTAGAFVLAAFYFGLLSVIDRESRDVGFIALMAMFAAMQLLVESLRAFMAFDYPWQVWRLIAITICAAGFALSTTAYLAKRFQPTRWRRYVLLAALITAPIAVFAPGFDSKALLSVLAPGVVAIFSVTRPAIRGERGARITAMALIAFIALIFIDGRNFLDRTFYIAAAMLMLVLFADQARAMRKARAQREEMRARAILLELELLRRTIAPHFLMNTLNSLVEWVESDPKTGVRMIEALADELRLLSYMSKKPLVPLAEELALCRRHLEVMSYRVDRAFLLRTENVDERLAVPPGVIHTLIENAFTHGRFLDGAVFTIRQSSENGRIAMTLETPPAETPAVIREERGGDGLAYVIRRLRAAFGASAAFVDGPSAEGGWRSTLNFDGRTL